MKHKLLNKLLFLLLCILGGASSAWADDYERITSTEDLVAGAQYILVCEGKSKVMGTIGGSTSVGSSQTATITSNTITANANYNILTLGGSSEGWTFYTSKESKYLSWSSGNSLAVSDAVSGDNQKWTVSFSSNNAEILNKKDSSRKLQFNASSPRFACYTTGQTVIQLYKKKTDPVSSVAVAPTSATIGVGGTVDLTATISPDNATDKSVTWSSENEDIATVSSSGIVTGIAEGEVDIWATSNADGTKKAKCTVTVEAATPVTGVTLDFTSKAMKVGEDLQLTATLAPADATNKNVSWESSDNTIATVTSAGLVTAVKAGSATITVTTEDGSFTATCSLTITNVDVTGVSLNKTSTSISVGETETLTATVAPANAQNKAVTWTSSNTSVATVSDGVVTAVAAGSTTITVTTTDGSFTATCDVTVDNAVSFTAGTDKGKSESNGSGDEVNKSGVTISSNNAAFATAQYRLYSGSTTTISVHDGKITTIEFTINGSYDLSNLSTSTGTYNSTSGVWTGVATSVAFSASAQVRLDKIKVYYATTATPTFSVAEGEYSEAKSVEISCATDGAKIYYTTDGTTPTSSSTAYSSAIPVTETTTLKAIAIKSGVESEVASATYTMNRPDAPEFDVVTCVFDAAFDLHLSAADGTTIYYTTDGTTPTSSCSTYSTKVAVSAATTTVKAIAVKNGLTSDVASETYTYDSRITPTFTLSTTNIDLKVNDSSSAVTLTTNSDATPSFTCDDPHVTLTGTGNSRTISANAAGTYTVNVSVTESATYKDAAGIVTVNVTKKATTMVITTAFDDGKDLYTASEGLIEGVVKYNDADLSPQPTITYSSSDETVATVDEDGIITFKKAGTTTITASYAGDDEYEECKGTYNLDLVDTTPQEMVVNISLNNTFFGCEPFTTYPASSPTSYEGTKDKITVTYAKGTGSGYYCNANGIRLYLGGSLTFEAPLGYVITSIAMSGESGFEEGLTNPEAVTTWKGKSNSVTITGETKSGNTRKNMTGATVSLAETVTIGSAGYTTYVAKNDISFPDGLTAYISTSKTSETLTLTEKASVPQGTPIILEGSAGTYALPTITTSPEDVTGNLLQASDGSVTGDGSTIFALGVGKTGANEGKVGFYLVGSGVQVPAGKAYLVVGAGAKEFLTFDFDDEATSIEETLSNSILKGENIYNLAGQRLNKMQKGINIVNGKKVLR